jgi:tripartite ATP-independent transporter DctM subunit
MSFEKVEKIQSGVEKGFIALSSAIIGTMMLITTTDVVLRYLFNSPLPGIFILCEMFMVCAVYLSVAYVQQQKGHVRVDIIIDRLKGRSRIVIELSILIVSLVAFCLVCWRTGLNAWEAWLTDDHSMGLVEYPYWPAKTILSIGVGLLCLRFVADIKSNFTQLMELSRSEGGRPYRLIIWSLLAVLPLFLLLIFLFTGSFGLNMEPMTVGWIILVVMILLLLGGLPVSFSLLILGIIGYWMIAGPLRTFSITGIVPYDKVANYTLSVVPLFILMGNLAYGAGFADSLYVVARKWIGHIPGSLAQATVVGGAVFAAACGSGLASCATLARVCIPAMRNVGVDTRLAIGTVAATGTIAQMIPPSITMVIYAIITDQSVAKLLIAGIIPGLLAAFNYMVLIYVRCKINPGLAPKLPERASWKERVISLKYSWGIIALAVIVMGGIYTGIFTPTEAGALGACGALVLGIVTKKLKSGNLKVALMDSAKTTGTIFLIVSSALLFGYFLGISRIPDAVSSFLSSLQVPRLVILIGILLMYVVAGFFIDMLPFAFLTLPIIFPAIVKLGYDPLWFGVITVHMFEMGLVTPPFGLNLFIIRGMVPDEQVSMRDVISGVTWFIVVDLITLVMYVAFPALATWLPNKMWGP